MHVFYGGTEDFAVRLTGDAMASALRDAVSAVDVELAARLVFDPESGGLEVGAPAESDLRTVLGLGRQAGLLTASFVDGVEIDDLDELEALADDGDVGVEPGGRHMSIHSVTDRGVVGAFDAGSFLPGNAPAATVSGLLDHARRTLIGDEWGSVHLSSTPDDVLVEAPDLPTLGRAADALGTLGLGSAPEMDVAFLRNQRDDIYADEPRDWVPRVDPEQPTDRVARGYVSDVTVVYVHGDIAEATAIMEAALSAVDPERAARVGVTLTYDMTVVLSGSGDDVVWAGDVLRASPM